MWGHALFSRDFPQITNGKEKSARFFDSHVSPQTCALQQQNLPADRLRRILFRAPSTTELLRDAPSDIYSKNTACENLTSLLSSSSLCKLPFSYLATLNPKISENSSCVKFRFSRISLISSG